ncbi:hypothetical protein [Lysinibacillus pakistanensis]
MIYDFLVPSESIESRYVELEAFNEQMSIDNEVWKAFTQVV